ncbi:MAG: ABC transporter permease [Christensenellaceae bacterium]|jgi:ribose transport system permease protein
MGKDMEQTAKGNFLRNNLRNFSVFIPSVLIVIVMLVVGQILVNGFASITSLSGMLMSASLLVIPAIGQTTVVMSGNDGIDMSIGAIMSMTALLGPMIKIGGSMVLPFSLVIVLGIGALWGLVNGMLIWYLKIPALVLTLAMSYVIDGASFFITKAQPAVDVSKSLTNISQIVFPPIRILTLIAIIVLIAMQALLTYSRFGKQLVLVGNNRKAANLGGMPVSRISILAYVISGTLAGFAGLLLVGFAGSAQMQMASNYTLLTVAAAVIGGTKLAGGVGNFISTALGALALIMLTTILQAMNMPSGARVFVQGAILLIILLINNRSEKLRQ